MGRNISQIKYPCDGGCDYGSCDKTNAYVFIYYRGTSTFTLYSKYHLENPKSKLEYMGGGTDDDLHNLIKILTARGEEAEEMMNNIDESISNEIRDKKII